jgi:hypothetical protein
MRTMNFLKMIGHIINDRRFILAAVVALVSAVPYAGSVVAREKALNGPPIGDVIAEWHQEAVRLTILPASGLAPVQQSQAMTIVQVSVHDAVNGITREHETYLSRLPAPAGASPEAAAIAASYHALRNLFPSHSTSLDALFANSLAAHGLSINDPGIGYGITAATRILTARMNDGSGQAQFNYVAPGAGLPGVWVPLTSLPALLPGWGNTTTWVLRSSSQFRPEAPPALNSERYARDYNEVKIIGAANSPLRTGEQTQIATFWLGSPVAIWSQPLAQLNALQGGLSLSQRARTFALMYIAAADSGIACWEAKYFYNFWRPQPAIQRGIEDGNPLTAPDPTWTPLVPTPRHPEYPSGHTSNSTAMVAVLQMAFGDRPGVPINSTITGITRQWSSFGQGLDEVIDARVYSGIHFRTADEAGSRMGGQIAQFVVMHALRPCRGQGARCS